MCSDELRGSSVVETGGGGERNRNRQGKLQASKLRLIPAVLRIAHVRMNVLS